MKVPLVDPFGKVIGTADLTGDAARLEVTDPDAFEELRREIERGHSAISLGYTLVDDEASPEEPRDPVTTTGAKRYG